MKGGGDTGQPARKPVDEIFGLVGIAGGQLGDSRFGGLVLQRVVMDQRHRMDLDMSADDELHAREADAIGSASATSETPRPDWRY